jgi:probable F420-dependent oxidoreductase
MRVDVGVVFPQTEIGSDPNEIRAYAKGVEEIGFGHLAAYDHVLGAAPDRPRGWTGPFSEPPYTHVDAFHEVFVLFGYLAAITTQLVLMTRVLVLPQRQTALVAKQAAEVDVLSGGRLRLGVGLGWNAVEFEALGEDFTDRGRRMNEQVELLRALWSHDIVDFRGSHHHIDRAGILPRPPRGTIPIWFGGRASAALKRAAALGEGWVSPIDPSDEFVQLRAELWSYLKDCGRSTDSFGVAAKIELRADDIENCFQRATRFGHDGGTLLSLNTMGQGHRTSGQHLRVLETFMRRWQHG